MTCEICEEQEATQTARHVGAQVCDDCHRYEPALADPSHVLTSGEDRCTLCGAEETDDLEAACSFVPEEGVK